MRSGTSRIFDNIQRWAAETPDRTAIVFQGRNRTWAELDERIRRAATALRSAGLRQGDRFAVLDKNHPACLELTLAASLIGAVNAVVNFRLAPAAAEDCFLQLYTSGTTGWLKGAMLPQRGMVEHTRVAVYGYEMNQASINVVAMPLFHAGGTSWALGSMSAGGRTLIVREIDPSGTSSARTCVPPPGGPGCVPVTRAAATTRATFTSRTGSKT